MTSLGIPTFYRGVDGMEAAPQAIDLGIVRKFTTALNILRAIRALALNTGDDELTAYALELQAAVIEWSKILPAAKEADQGSDRIASGYI